jgi:hypothetical protein
MSMKRVTPLYSVAIVALLLPGLVLAAPIAGTCGRCGEGDDCHLQQSVQPAPGTQSCCDTASEAPPEPSFDSSNCECGREAPPALSADASLTVETTSVEASVFESVRPTSGVGSKFSCPGRPPPPPPTPPTFLIDCAFLT